MKTSLVLAFAVLASGGVLAQPGTNAPSPVPAASAPALAAPAQPEKTPAPAPAKKPAAARKKAMTPPAKATAKKPVAPAVPLMPGPATVTTENVNVRGQAKLTSDRVTQLKAGDTVTVLEEIILEKPAADEPARWARITLPAGTKVWVNTLFVDTTNMTVISRRLNLRSGPGENFSIVGLVEKGEQLREVGSTRGDWMQVEAPKTAYGFVASHYLKQEAPAAALATTAPPASPVVPSVATPIPEATPPPPPPAAPTSPAVVATPTTEPPLAAAASEPATFKDLPLAAAPQKDSRAIAKAREALRRKMAALAAAKVPTGAAPEEPLPPRIVAREGVVRISWNVQAPTKHALVNPANGRTINYLYTTSTNLNLDNYKGLRIVVTGEEGLDERWKNTPVLTIQRIQVIE